MASTVRSHLRFLGSVAQCLGLIKFNFSRQEFQKISSTNINPLIFVQVYVSFFFNPFLGFFGLGLQSHHILAMLLGLQPYQSYPATNVTFQQTLISQ